MKQADRLVWTDRSGPMTDMLRAADGAVRFHMPGHKGRADPYDMTELPKTDDLYAPTGAIAQAERLAAMANDAAATLMLTGGSTAGLLAMLLTAVAPGETLVLDRRAHHAAVSACILGDIRVCFADDPLAALQTCPQARAVLITRPDYYGRCTDLAPIVAAARARGAWVLVDEAHGAHFAWWDSPATAGRLGADAWVQSAHKTLPALTGAAWLHLAGTMDAARARRMLRLVQTSSPPFPILRSLDAARAWMDAHGRQALGALAAMLSRVRAEVTALGGYVPAAVDDPTRLVIETRERGYTGMAVQSRLTELGVDIEMADDDRIVCICTVDDDETAFRALIGALAEIPQRPPLHDAPPYRLPRPGARLYGVREAALSPQEAVPLCGSAGRVAAVSAGLYPPGIPFVLPGEQITDECVQALLRCPPARRFGVEEGYLLCMRPMV